MSKYATAFLAASLAVLSLAAPAFAADPSRTISLETQDLTGGKMALEANVQTVSAGKVTFLAHNGSNLGHDHEVLMVKTDLEPKDLPKTADGKSIDEKKLKGIVELGDMGPDGSKTTKLALKPGSYLLFCNLPGHTGAGMWSRLIVTPKVAAVGLSKDAAGFVAVDAGAGPVSVTEKRKAVKTNDNDHDGDIDITGQPDRD